MNRIENGKPTIDFRTKDGRERWLSNAAVQVRDDNGRAIGSLGILQDITERKRTETALKESEARLNAVVEKTTTMLVVVNRDGEIQFANTAFNQYNEHQSDDRPVMRHLNILKCIQATGRIEACGDGAVCDACLMRHLITQTFTTGESYDRVEVVIPNPESNRELDTVFLVSTTLLGNEREDCLLISIEDISNIKHVERALERLLSIEEALSNVSRMFSIQKEPDFNKILKILGTAVHADRAYIFRFDTGGASMSNVFEWCAPGITRQIQNLQHVAFDTIPWWTNRIGNDETILIENIETLPEEAMNEKFLFLEQDIRSLLAVPIVLPTGFRIGFIGYDSVKNTHQWRPEDVQIIRVAAEMISNFWSREDAIASLRESENRRRFAMQAAGMGTWQWDIATGEIEWDENTFQIFGRKTG